VRESARISSETPTPDRARDLPLAGAPISWGVCEIPGWGTTVHWRTVLEDLRDVGLDVTELGPPGYFGTSASTVRQRLDAFDVQALGGFVPLPLHDRRQRGELEAAARAAVRHISGCGGRYLVGAAAPGRHEPRGATLTPDGWRTLVDNLAWLDGLCDDHGLVHVFHPHVGTMIESAGDVWHLLEVSAARLCLDTGHLTLGGGDPAQLAREAGERVGLVHLKDVHPARAADLAAGVLSFRDATRAGLFTPLGRGCVDIDGTISALQDLGYRGWYVLEQDRSLEREPTADDRLRDVRLSLEHLRRRVPSGAPGR
jgi:inosose dehydratase